MGVLHGNPFLIASGTPTEPTFPLQRSIRLRSSAPAYFSRSAYPVSGAGTKWTMSMWLKRGALSSQSDFFTFVSTTGSAQQAGIQFDSNGAIRWWQYVSPSYAFQKITTAVFRDPSAWYHFVFIYDTTLATAEDRLQIWVNGVRQTSFSTNTNPSQNLVTYYNTGVLYPYLGAENRNASSALNPFDGYLTEVNFIDGQALTPLSFGGYNPGTNVWEPKAYTGAYGTNGFYLPFIDNTSTTHLGLSKNTGAETNTFWTAIGSAALNTTTKKFGAGSVFFPGSTSRLDGGTTLLSDLNGVDWTIEGWIYPTSLAAAYSDILGSNSSGQTSSVSIKTGTTIGNKIALGDWGTGASFSTVTSTTTLPTNQWTHYAFTKQGTTLRCFVNGTLEATVTSANTTFPSFTCSMGNRGNGDLPFIGYMDDVRITKGIAQYTSSFTAPTVAHTLTGETNPVTMLMDFDSSITVGQRLKIWNPTGISLTAGVTYDSMLDVPTISGSNNANFCTLNQLRKGTGVTLSEANLTWSITLNNAVAGTIGVSSGKWYWEVTAGTRTYVGIVNESASIQNQLAGINGGYCYAFAGIKYSNGGTSASYGATYTSGDIIGAALDMDAGTITFYKNGVSQGVAFTGLSGIYFPATGSDSISTATGSINFGQRPFAYPIPSGHKMLNTFNLPEPTIPRGDKYFEQYLYTGNGGGQQVGEIQKPMSLFNLDRSLRFRASNSAYLNRTWGTPTDARKFTCSFWLKRGLLSGAYQPFGGGTAAANAGGLQFLSSDALNFYWENATNCNLVTTNVYKDPSLWYNIVVIQDTTQATAGNRLQIYVNGILQTLTGTYPAQNASATFNSATVPFGIMAGRTTSFGLFTDGYLGDFYWIDGQANAATSFGQFDGNNYWTPKAYTGTYGTNGFHLEFEDFSNNTATTIGKDTSGNGNNWTPTGISVTAGITYDSMKDVPTLTSTDTANYCTFNPLDTGGGSVTLSGGNLNYSIASSTGSQVRGTMGTDLTSKWYWEYTAGSVASPTNPQVFGISTVDGPITNNSSALKLAATIYTDGSTNYLANKVINGVSTSITTQFRSVAIGDILQVAYDAATGNLWFGKNNTWYDATNGTTGNPSTGTNPVWTLPTGSSMTPYLGNLGATYSGSLNCGQRPFIGTVPTGFKSLNSFNIAEVSGDVETADLVRIKSRSATTPALWFNSVSGAGKYILGNNNTAGEATDVNSLIQFNKNGLLIGNNANINTLSATYIADVWKAGDSTVTNTAGSITSQVRANPISGISVVTYTGNGISTATVGHGLGIQPAMVILKSRSLVNNWWVAHKGSPNSWLQLDTTGAAGTGGGTGGAINYQSTFTNSVFGFLNGSSNVNNVNQNLATYVAYCFLEIPGFSKFDSYISNGSSTDGPFVYTGFRPRWVMIKQRDVTRSWIMYDTTRNTFNVVDKYFFMEGLNNNEQTAALLDINSNGFKLKNNNVNTNTTAGQVYIYMAFAEHPFKYALAR